MNVIHFVSDGFNEYNSSRWRVSNIAEALIREGHVVKVLHIQHWLAQTPLAKTHCASSDIIVIHRVSVRESIRAALIWQRKGKAVVLDFDDSYDNLEGDFNPAKHFWIDSMITVKNADGSTRQKKLDEPPLETLKEAISIFTATTLPSKVLCKDWAKYGTTIYLENYINDSMYEGIVKHDNSPNILIGWGGSLGHIDSFRESGVIQALDRLFNKHEKAFFLLIGDRRIIKYLSFPEKVIFRPYVTYDRWPLMLAQYDIGIAPLAKEFDKRRSPIKLTEYTTMGIPYVATYDPDENYVVYENYKNANGFLIKNDTDEWYNALDDMIENIDRHRKEAKENYHIAEKYFARNNVDAIIQTYQRILELR